MMRIGSQTARKRFAPDLVAVSASSLFGILVIPAGFFSNFYYFASCFLIVFGVQEMRQGDVRRLRACS
jgi:hypothetical protein